MKADNDFDIDEEAVSLAQSLALLAEFGVGLDEIEEIATRPPRKSAKKARKVYAASSIKRRRRTKEEIARDEDAAYQVLAESHPMTLRGLFYQLVTRRLIDKRETEYDKLGRSMVKMRRSGRVPYQWLVDSTRWMRKPQTWGSLDDALWHTVQTYRRALWNEQEAYVEIWVEKNALAGILMLETEPWDVPLMVSVGFSSETYLYEAAQAVKYQHKPAYIYYFGDHDPSGVSIPRKIEERLRAMAPNSEIHFTRVAVNEEQIVEMNLPTRPTKKSDSRSKNFKGESVEVDAIHPATLRAMVRECITRHIDEGILRRVQRAEELERDSLEEFISAWGRSR